MKEFISIPVFFASASKYSGLKIKLSGALQRISTAKWVCHINQRRFGVFKIAWHMECSKHKPYELFKSLPGIGPERLCRVS